MPRLVAAGLVLVLVVYALIDCLQAPRREVRAMPKPAWLAVVLLLPVVGAVAWLVAGRPRAAAAPPPRPVAPDDDTEFLGRLRTLDEEHEDLVRRWEREERRRADREAGRPDDHDAPPEGGGRQGDGPRGRRADDEQHDAPVDDGREPGS
jgi:hypothetical protein